MIRIREDRYVAIFSLGILIILALVLITSWAFIDVANSGEERLKIIEAKCLSLNQTMIPAAIVPQQARCYDNNNEVHEYILE